MYSWRCCFLLIDQSLLTFLLITSGRRVGFSSPGDSYSEGFGPGTHLSAEELERQVLCIQESQWKSACDSSDIQQLLQIWCTRAETYLYRFTGRGSPKQPKLGYVCKRSNDSLSGAQFAEAKDFPTCVANSGKCLDNLKHKVPLCKWGR